MIEGTALPPNKELACMIRVTAWFMEHGDMFVSNRSWADMQMKVYSLVKECCDSESRV